MWRVLDRILHPIARRRRTAAHGRVLYRHRHTGLVTGVPSERFELTAHNRRLLGLDGGPPRVSAPDERDESGDAVGPDRSDLSERDDPSEPSE
jgi:hypothetical protein